MGAISIEISLVWKKNNSEDLEPALGDLHVLLAACSLAKDSTMEVES